MSIERWKGKVAVVTGAGSGIGAAIAVELAKKGLKTYGLDIQVTKVEILKKNLTEEDGKNLTAMKCDITNEKNIVEVFAEIVKLAGGIDILINNAGIIRMLSSLDEDNSTQIRSVIETNLIGLIFCTREAFKSMRARKSDGHIIHINSLSGHKNPLQLKYPSFGAYAASKHGVTAMAETHRQDIIREKMNVKVTSLSCGGVRTNIMGREGMTAEQNKAANFPILEPENIAEAVVYLLGVPPHVQIDELTIRQMGDLM